MEEMKEQERRAAWQEQAEEIDWWGDGKQGASRPQRSERLQKKEKRGMSTASMAMCLLTCIVFILCIFGQLYRLTLITGQGREIAALQQEIDELTSERQNLEVRMSLQLNLERIKDEATNRLGMVYPGEEQIRVIAVAGTNEGVQTANAVAEEGGQ